MRIWAAQIRLSISFFFFIVFHFFISMWGVHKDRGMNLGRMGGTVIRVHYVRLLNNQILLCKKNLSILHYWTTLVTIVLSREERGHFHFSLVAVSTKDSVFHVRIHVLFKDVTKHSKVNRNFFDLNMQRNYP